MRVFTDHQIVCASFLLILTELPRLAMILLNYCPIKRPMVGNIMIYSSDIVPHLTDRQNDNYTSFDTAIFDEMATLQKMAELPHG